MPSTKAEIEKSGFRLMSSMDLVVLIRQKQRQVLTGFS